MIEILSQKRLPTDKKIIHINEAWNEFAFKRVEGGNSSIEYELEEKKDWRVEHLLDYKIKVIKEHPMPPNVIPGI